MVRLLRPLSHQAPKAEQASGRERSWPLKRQGYAVELVEHRRAGALAR
tara:strand:- start:128 stop:271 length:144 start_codon:yes stop_codon:yes gene_type:complete